MRIPSLLLKQLYTFGSLKNVENQVQFSLKNRLSDAKFVGLQKVILNGKEIPLSSIKLNFDDGSLIAPNQVSQQNPIDFPLRQTVDIIAEMDSLEKGSHKIEVVFDVKPFGTLHIFSSECTCLKFLWQN